MLLFIDSDQNKSTGWQGYDFLLNGAGVTATESVLKRFDANNGWIDQARFSIRIKGSQLMMAVPRDLLNTQNFDNHWVDHPEKLETISDLFDAGDNSPERRANFRISITPN